MRQQESDDRVISVHEFGWQWILKNDPAQASTTYVFKHNQIHFMSQFWKTECKSNWNSVSIRGGFVEADSNKSRLNAHSHEETAKSSNTLRLELGGGPWNSVPGQGLERSIAWHCIACNIIASSLRYRFHTFTFRLLTGEISYNNKVPIAIYYCLSPSRYICLSWHNIPNRICPFDQRQIRCFNYVNSRGHHLFSGEYLHISMVVPELSSRGEKKMSIFFSNHQFWRKRSLRQVNFTNNKPKPSSHYKSN
jgi:hypothetical protein